METLSEKVKRRDIKRIVKHGRSEKKNKQETQKRTREERRTLAQHEEIRQTKMYTNDANDE
jgi:hypothetical protein